MAKRTKRAPVKKAARSAEPDARKLVRERDALAKLLDDKLRELARLRLDGAETWDRQWEIVDAILDGDPPLWQGRYRTEKAFIAKELPNEDRFSVRRNILVAAAFAPKDIDVMPIGLLEELARYVEQRTGAQKLGPVDLDRLRVDLPDGRTIPARKASIEDVRAARRALRAVQKKEAKRSRRAEAVEKAVRRKKTLRGVAITLTKQGVSFGRVPYEALRDLGAALTKLALPDEEP